MNAKAKRSDRPRKLNPKSETHAIALSRWDDEGGAVATPGQRHGEDISGRRWSYADAETARLHMRVIALENLVIAVLARGSDGQRQSVIDMATLIAPRDGATPHRLTVAAAARMRHLVGRGDYFSSAWNT